MKVAQMNIIIILNIVLLPVYKLYQTHSLIYTYVLQTDLQATSSQINTIPKLLQVQLIHYLNIHQFETRDANITNTCCKTIKIFQQRETPILHLKLNKFPKWLSIARTDSILQIIRNEECNNWYIWGGWSLQDEINNWYGKKHCSGRRSSATT